MMPVLVVLHQAFTASLISPPQLSASSVTELTNNHSAPAENAIEWEWRRIDAIPNQGPFSGDPSEEIDAAWVELMQGINLKIYPEEMEKLGQNSLEFKDKSGYVGGLSVYHELHCIVCCKFLSFLAFPASFLKCRSRESS